MQKELKKAAQIGAKINIIYVSTFGTVSKRIICIISCTDERIIGYCYMRRQIRTFKIANILAMERTEHRMEAFV